MLTMNERRRHRLATLTSQAIILVGLVTFSTGSSNFTVRLGGNEGAFEGPVEMMFDGQWIPTCHERRRMSIFSDRFYFDTNELIVVCRQLGFPGANRVNRDLWLTRRPTPFNRQLSFRFSCQGNETQLNGCNIYLGRCYDDFIVRAKCYSKESGYVGCYVRQADDFALEVQKMLQADNMTIDFCRRFCQMREYKYFGLAAGDQCLCQNVFVEQRQRRDDRLCQAVCRGDRNSSCGGYPAVAMFKVTPRSSSMVPHTISTSFRRTQISTATTLQPSNHISAAAAAAAEASSTPEACTRIVVHTGAVTVAVIASFALAVFAIIFLVYLKRRGKRNGLSPDTTDGDTYTGLQTLSGPDSLYQGLKVNAESKSNDHPDQIYENQVVVAPPRRKGHLRSNAGDCGDNEYSFCE